MGLGGGARLDGQFDSGEHDLFVMLQEWVEKGLAMLQDLFNPRDRGNSTRRFPPFSG